MKDTWSPIFEKCYWQICDYKFVKTKLWRTYDDANFWKILWRFYDLKLWL